MNDEKPNASPAFTLVRPDGTPVEWDWKPAVDRLALNDGTFSDFLYADRGRLSFLFVHDAADLTDLLGPWPGTPPETPDGLFSPVG